MEILVYRPGAEKVESGFSVDQLPALLKETTSVVWVDIEEPTEADDRILLDVFRFHPLTVEDCRETRNYPKVEEFPGYLYFIVHGVKADTSPDHFNTIELDAFLGPNFVITYHHDMFRSITNVKKLLCTKSSIRLSIITRRYWTTLTSALPNLKMTFLRLIDRTKRSSKKSWI